MSTPNPQQRQTVAEFWAPRNLRDQVAETLKAAGRDQTNTTVKDLSEFDQYNTGGAEVTLGLAREAGIKASDHVLEVASGLGGTARLLASEIGCQVTGIDLTPQFFETAELFNAITGLSNKIAFQVGDATDLPFEDGQFDVVWTQHATQAIPEKEQLFSEMARVLKPGGVLVMHDPYRGREGVPYTYPACWDRDGSMSFFPLEGEMRAYFTGAGLEIEKWNDLTTQAKGWTHDLNEVLAAPADPDAPPAGIPGLDFSLFFGFDDLQTMMLNMEADIDSGALGFFEALARKPA